MVETWVHKVKQTIKMTIHSRSQSYWPTPRKNGLLVLVGIVEEEKRHQLCFRRTASASRGSGPLRRVGPRKRLVALLRKSSDDSAGCERLWLKRSQVCGVGGYARITKCQS